MNHVNGIPRQEDARLQLWTVYDHPKDYPQHYVARLSFVGAAGQEMTEHLLGSTDASIDRTVSDDQAHGGIWRQAVRAQPRETFRPL